MNDQARLSEYPDWAYLMRDIYDIYRYRSAGGSDRIRSHMRQVRQALLRNVNADPVFLARSPATKPVCTHLNRALDQDPGGGVGPILRGLRTVRQTLEWQYGYDKIPPALARKYAFAELLGPDGPVFAEDLVIGLVLFAPGCTYPEHAHDGLVESYLCLSGAMSENDTGVYYPGSLILNPPAQRHRITSDGRDPCLLLYAWVGTPERLATRPSAFTRRAKTSSR